MNYLLVILLIVAAYMLYMFFSQPQTFFRFMSAFAYAMMMLFKGIFLVLVGIAKFIGGMFRRRR